MAQDDFHVVLYKILSYLYECLKAGVRPRLEVVQSEVGIKPTYWSSIIQMALESGYIAGIHQTQYKDRRPDEQLWAGTPKITEKGIEYLLTNSMMAKAKGLLTDVWPAVLQTAVALTTIL